ncbi:MAG: hypothetical protein AAFN50_11375 [Pseudomonadota bacterium]
MNNEQNESDTLVSNAYRESAQETTPRALDDAVLRMAAKGNSATKLPRLLNWTKPLTWALTAGLAVAIFYVPQVGDIAPGTAPLSLPESQSVATPPSAALEEAFSADHADVIQEAEKMARIREGDEQPPALEKARREQESRVEDEFADQAVASRARGTTPAVRSDALAYDLAQEKKESADDTTCSETSREQAQSWYDCVVALRDQDRTLDAEREMLELVEKFPDFQPNK